MLPTQGLKRIKKKQASPKSARGKPWSGATGSPVSEDDAEINENTSNIYDAISLQLLDLMYVLHTKASTILANVDWDEFAESQRLEVKMRWNSVESVDKIPSTFTGKAYVILANF